MSVINHAFHLITTAAALEERLLFTLSYRVYRENQYPSAGTGTVKPPPAMSLLLPLRHCPKRSEIYLKSCGILYLLIAISSYLYYVDHKNDLSPLDRREIVFCVAWDIFQNIAQVMSLTCKIF
ncbi:hypothetical protein JOD82_001657 [Paenibacillus sp. 1182]|nr:hypothetical protein [Paenibacillus sp. 1182]